jgi:hypothetical protein
MKAGRSAVVVLGATVGALGFALLVAQMGPMFIDGLLARRLATLVAFVAAEAALLAWVGAESSQRGRLRRSQGVALAEFIAFGVLGVLASIRSLYDLLP